MSFKVIDFGHARLIGDKPGAKLPGSPAMEKWYRRCELGRPPMCCGSYCQCGANYGLQHLV